LNYFGEDVSDYRCEKCDNCTSTGRLRASSTNYVSEIIIETLEEAEELPENFLVKILRGIKVKESAARFNHFGSCKKFSSSEIRGVISQEVSKGKILKSTGKRNYLSLPKKVEKIEAIAENKSKNDSHEFNEELYLYNLLREVRKKTADRFLQSAYLVCPDNVLREVARIQPKSKYEMLKINGFNSRMFNKIGNDFLEIINSNKRVEIERNKIKKNEGLPQNIIETKKLVGRKYTLKEIAETIKLSEAVISMQIETLVEFEPDTDISSLIKNEVVQQIIEEVQKGFKNLKELKERLPSKVSYPEIRIAVAKFKADPQRSSLNAQHKQ
jgi:ATP-dependent DNA helicase RecQ